MDKNNKNIDQSNSMIDISYQILLKKQAPMSIQELIKNVCKIKKINSKDIDACLQLYLDIVSSGLFVFCGNDLWDIKKNNLNLWDQEYFLDPNDKETKETNIKTEDIEKEILDFKDFDLKKEENKEHEEIEEQEDNEKNEEKDKLDSDLLDENDDNLDDNDDKIEEEVFDEI